MNYDEALQVILMITKQYRNGYYISQSDYNNFLNALDILNAVKEKIGITK